MRIIAKDKYKRSVAEVWKDAANANLEMVKTGKTDHISRRGNTAIDPLRHAPCKPSLSARGVTVAVSVAPQTSSASPNRAGAR